MALRVLLADESTTIKKVMQLALQDFAVEVKSVQSGIDVIEVAKTFQPDIIFVDVLLQKKNGYEVGADLKNEATLQAIPLVLMWSSFMDLDERLAQNSRCDRRLEKPFDVENLRQIVLELVPKTRTQRLAHFLKFPENLNEGLRQDESARTQKPPPAERAGAAALPNVAKPSPPERPGAPPSLEPPRSETPAPKTVAPPTVSAARPRLEEQPPPAGGAPRSPGRSEMTPDFGDVTRPSHRLSPVPAAPDSDEEESIDLSSIGTRPGAETADDRAPRTGPSDSDNERANWNMESFDEIDAFAPDKGGDDRESLGLAHDPDDDEGFKEIRLARPSDPTSEPDLNKTRVTRSAAPEDGDPWSHKDLARFKLDLPPIESAYEEDDLGESKGRIELEVGKFAPDAASGFREPSEHSDFLHRREASGVRPGLPKEPPRGVAPRPPVLEFDDGGEEKFGAEFSASHVNTDDLQIEDPALAGGESVYVPAPDEGRRRERPAPPIGSPIHSGAPSFATPAPPGRLAGLAKDEIERIVRAQSREIIETLVRRIVPDIASDIIRQELDRLLSERDGAPR